MALTGRGRFTPSFRSLNDFVVCSPLWECHCTEQLLCKARWLLGPGDVMEHRGTLPSQCTCCPHLWKQLPFGAGWRWGQAGRGTISWEPGRQGYPSQWRWLETAILPRGAMYPWPRLNYASAPASSFLPPIPTVHSYVSESLFGSHSGCRTQFLDDSRSGPGSFHATGMVLCLFSRLHTGRFLQCRFCNCMRRLTAPYLKIKVSENLNFSGDGDLRRKNIFNGLQKSRSLLHLGFVSFFPP